MIYCPRCGKDNEDNARYCNYCGSYLLEITKTSFEKRMDDFADDVEKLAKRFGKKAEGVAIELKKGLKEAGGKFVSAMDEAGKSIDKALSPEPRFCSKCGAKIIGHPNFCRDCGSKI